MKLANLALYTYTWRKLPPRATPDTPPQAAAMLMKKPFTAWKDGTSEARQERMIEALEAEN